MNVSARKVKRSKDKSFKETFTKCHMYLWDQMWLKFLGRISQIPRVCYYQCSAALYTKMHLILIKLSITRSEVFFP